MEQNKEMPVEKCKGTRDLSPKEMKLFRAIEGVFRDSCLKWGYDEVRTPTLEYLYLFTAAGTLTPGKLERVYSFLDWDGWSGERVVLRPDGTIPIARYYIETLNGKGSAKLFYVNNVFSFEQTGKEAREKWQCGAELIGSGPATGDVELVVMALEVLQKLGIKDVELRLSHAGFIRAILSKFEIDQEEQHRLIDRIMDGDTQALAGARPELAGMIGPMLNTKGKSSGFLKNVSVMLGHDFPELKNPLLDFTNLAAALDSLKVEYEIDIATGRGFEYYTGLIFQIWSGEEMVAGGGRYDALIPLLGGSEVPASGFALYVDKIMSLVEALVPTEPAVDRVIVRPQPGTDSVKTAFEAIKVLHDAGWTAEIVAPESPADLTRAKWLLETRETGWRFQLHNLGNDDQYEAATLDEVITRLEN
jgi:histidyl-tRNA synthetase